MSKAHKEQQAGSVALWTNGKVTIVLPKVTMAYWAVENPDDSETRTYEHAEPATADRFIVEFGNDVCHEFDYTDDYRSVAVSFLRALSLYWETRV